MAAEEIKEVEKAVEEVSKIEPADAHQIEPTDEPQTEPQTEPAEKIVDITEEAIRQSKNGRRQFNAYLESFYNANGIEEPTYVRHFFFWPKSKRKLPENIVKAYEKLAQK